MKKKTRLRINPQDRHGIQLGTTHFQQMFPAAPVTGNTWQRFTSFPTHVMGFQNSIPDELVRRRWFLPYVELFGKALGCEGFVECSGSIKSHLFERSSERIHLADVQSVTASFTS
jgi:hypothetical protein